MKNFTLTLTALIFSLYCQSQTFSNSILMDGLNDYIAVNDNINLNQTSTISIEAWIRPCDATNNYVILSKNWCAGSQNAYNLAVGDGKLEWVWDTDGCGNGANIYRSDSAIILPDVWQHIAVVHTTTDVSLYLNGAPVNGTLINGNYSNIKVSNEPLRIGAYKNLAGNITSLFNGFMDEVRIWDYAVSSAEIMSRYNNELLGTEAGLVGYYNMNAISGMGSGLNVENNATITGNTLDGTTIGTGTSPSVVGFNESNCSALGLEEYVSNYSVYPNPTTGHISINLGETKNNLKLSLINYLGQIVLTNEFVSTDFINIDIDVPAGVYFLQLETAEGERIIIKILKK